MPYLGLNMTVLLDLGLKSFLIRCINLIILDISVSLRVFSKYSNHRYKLIIKAFRFENSNVNIE